MPKELHVYDFDNTLFRSPIDTKENQIKFEKATGMPWLIDKNLSNQLTKKHGKYIPMRRGWWGRAETLEPPLVPNPAPAEWFIETTVKSLINSKKDPNVKTLILTGRHSGLRQHVLRICTQGNLIKTEIKGKSKFYESVDPHVTLHLLGDDGPQNNKNKPGETFPWKVWMIDQYLSIYSEITKLIIWEDRSEHVEEFRKLDGVLADLVIVNHVTDAIDD